MHDRGRRNRTILICMSNQPNRVMRCLAVYSFSSCFGVIAFLVDIAVPLPRRFNSSLQDSCAPTTSGPQKHFRPSENVTQNRKFNSQIK